MPSAAAWPTLDRVRKPPRRSSSHRLNMMTGQETANVNDRQLGVDLFNHTWTLLEKENRTPDEDDEMVHAAHASAYHWLHANGAGPRRIARAATGSSRASTPSSVAASRPSTTPSGASTAASRTGSATGTLPLPTKPSRGRTRWQAMTAKPSTASRLPPKPGQRSPTPRIARCSTRTSQSSGPESCRAPRRGVGSPRRGAATEGGPVATTETATERDAIAAVMQHYIDGSAEGDASKLKQAFHPEARMYGSLGGQRMDIP